jgi:carbon-monoxide dehydrogenase large subunit
MDPRQIRKVNYIKPSQLPYKNAVGETLRQRRIRAHARTCSKLADWDGFNARKKAAKKRAFSTDVV